MPIQLRGPLPRRIVHVAGHYPPALGGMEQVVQALVRQQHQLGMDVQVLTSDQGATLAEPVIEPFPVVRMKSAEIAHTTITPGLLPRLFRLGRNVLVHLHISTAYTPEMVWLRARLPGVTYVAHVHLDVLPSGPAGVFLDSYKRLVLGRVLRDAAAVIVPTPDYRGLISAKYGIPAERIRVIRNGTDHEFIANPRSLCPAEAERRLLFVGRLSVQKNIPLMLEAIAAYVRRYGSGIRLAIVGEGESGNAIRALIGRLGLDAIVTMRGSLYGEELQLAFTQSDLLLLTSVNESFGLVLVEAMTKALPIVGVDIPAVRNVVANGTNGLLVEPTPDALAAAMHRLLTDFDLYAAVSKSNLELSRAYGWRAIAEEMAEIYASL
jgi:glycosyltransferase involved in cell wall biosynthesis